MNANAFALIISSSRGILVIIISLSRSRSLCGFGSQDVSCVCSGYEAGASQTGHQGGAVSRDDGQEAAAKLPIFKNTA